MCEAILRKPYDKPRKKAPPGLSEVEEHTLLSHRTTRRPRHLNKPSWLTNKSAKKRGSLLRFHELNEIGTLLVLLDACENHLRSRDVLLGVDQILEHVLVRPNDGCILVGFGIREPF